MVSDFSKIKCLVVDDEPIAIRGIVNSINKVDFLVVANTCASALEAGKILHDEKIDLMFLDINMPHLNGLEFIETLENPPLVIITTAYSEYALEGYRLQVVDYLLKPISFQRFCQAVKKAQSLLQLNSNTSNTPSSDILYVRQEGDKFQKINYKDILFIEALENYVKIHFLDETIIIHQTMIALEESLPNKLFFRVHKSYLINMSHISSIMGGRVFINQHEIPISRTKKELLLESVVYKNLISK